MPAERHGIGRKRQEEESGNAMRTGAARWSTSGRSTQPGKKPNEIRDVIVEGNAQMFTSEGDRRPIDLRGETRVLQFLLNRTRFHVAVRNGVHLAVRIENPADFVAREQRRRKLRPRER